MYLEEVMSVTQPVGSLMEGSPVPGCAVGRPAESSVVLHFTVCVLDLSDVQVIRKASLQSKPSSSS